MTVQNVAGLFDSIMRRHHIPGAQLAVYRGGELLELTHGVERLGQDTPVGPRSRFAYGSVSKIFTAALVAQLVDEGEADLDEPIADLLEYGSIPHGHPMNAVTLRQLLSHTAGLVSDHEGEPLRTPSLRRYFSSVLRTGHVNAPGTAFSYSNTGYAVAAYMVEVLTGRHWQDALRIHLADPAGLDLALVRDGNSLSATAPVVSGHAVNALTGKAEPVEFHVESTLAAAGGIAGSATALVDMGRALLTHTDTSHRVRIADPDVLAEMVRHVPAADPFGLADGWGSGWGLFGSADGTLWLGHDGTLDGGTCNVRVDPEGGTVLALTTNSTTGLAAWQDLVTELALGETDGDRLSVGHYRQPAPAGRPLTTAHEFTGEYTNGDLGINIRTTEDGSLGFDACNGLTGTVEIAGDLTFGVTAEDHGNVLFSGRFLRCPRTGEADLMQYNGRTLRRVAVAAKQAA